MSAWEEYLDSHASEFEGDLDDFLRIPSISALPEHAGDVQRAAEWVADRLQRAGMENIEILPTAGHPVVYADWLHADDAPTILIYGHFDVQPVDPVALWSSPPFEPTYKDGRVYARGASDDKGNMLVPILALEAFLRCEEGRLPVNVKVCFEGQEEIGSPDLPEFFARESARFAADLAVSADGGQFGEEEPMLLVGLRGICGIQIDVVGARADLHSGMHGGAVQNPIHALVALLDSMHDRHGRITVSGFYDHVVDLDDAGRDAIARVPFDEESYLADLGLEESFGEPGYTTRERSWIRPTLEINGIWGGFQGEGIKTVLPNQAHAKITCRLVPNQDPGQIVELLKRHVAEHAPAGVRTSVTVLGTRGTPYLISADHPGNQAVAAALRTVYNREPYSVRNGGSIPITGLFKQHLDLDTVSFAFGLRDENIHAPDEFYRLESFHKGQRAYCLLLEELAERGL